MSENNQLKPDAGLDSDEAHAIPSAIEPVTAEVEDVGINGLAAAVSGRRIANVALDDQVPRSWDVHKSGW